VSAVRVALALVLLALAAFVILLAVDLRAWQGAVRSGDTRYVQAPGTASWAASTVVPFRLGERILGLQGQLAFRRAAQSFVVVKAAGNGLDNGYSESRARGELEAELAELAQGSNRVRDAEADNLLGILAFLDSQENGPSAPAPVDRSVGDFQAAVQMDPANEDAKFNLEWLLRELLAHGERSGSNASSSGPAKGHTGAGGGTPGRGY
jgi:hypothetical protein